MELFVYFILTFLLTYLLSYFTIIRKSLSKKKKVGKRKKKVSFNEAEAKVPVEVEYLIKRYRIDVTKINYNKFLQVISLVASLDMAIAVVIITPIKNIYLQILVGFIVLIPLILVSYKLVGRNYIKKGMTKDGYEKNRK